MLIVNWPGHVFFSVNNASIVSDIQVIYHDDSKLIKIVSTDLTDLVLKDKIVVYDLAHQRIGWANYDCKFTREILLLQRLYI